MKLILLIFLTIIAQTTFSQSWETIEIGKSIIISVPLEKTQEIKSTDNEKITLLTTSGILTIESPSLPDSPKDNNSSIDVLNPYVDGALEGMRYGANVEVVENDEIVINTVKARNILTRTSQGQVSQFYFLIVNQKMYVIKFKENLGSSDSDRKRIFSSIKVK